MRLIKSNNILDITANYIIKLMVNELPHKYVYHGIHHTFEVVNYSKEIGFNSGLRDEELIDVVLSAWFHDVGFVESQENHEQKSAMAAESFLTQYRLPIYRLERISNCILATNLKVKPVNLMEKVICDADLAHIGQENYVIKQELLRIEIETCTGRAIEDLEWAKSNYKFLSRHKFNTEYANAAFREMKRINLDEVSARIEYLKELSETAAK